MTWSILQFLSWNERLGQKNDSCQFSSIQSRKHGLHGHLKFKNLKKPVFSKSLHIDAFLSKTLLHKAPLFWPHYGGSLKLFFALKRTILEILRKSHFTYLINLKKSLHKWKFLWNQKIIDRVQLLNKIFILQSFM